MIRRVFYSEVILRTVLILIIIVLIMFALRLSGVAFMLSGWVLKLFIIVGGLMLLFYWLSNRRR